VPNFIGRNGGLDEHRRKVAKTRRYNSLEPDRSTQLYLLGKTNPGPDVWRERGGKNEKNKGKDSKPNEKEKHRRRRERF